MRYLDTRTRSVADAAGYWILDDSFAALSSIRIQSGYFAADALPYLRALLERLEGQDAEAALVIGSNGGETSAAAVECARALLADCGHAWRFGLVRYSQILFHPKSVLLTRADGTRAAFVGSANFTFPGLSGWHVESGIVLDEADGDEPGVLDEIAASTEAWFGAARPGFTRVGHGTDLAQLVEARIIGVPRPRPVGSPDGGSAARPTHPTLKPLAFPPTITGGHPGAAGIDPAATAGGAPASAGTAATGVASGAIVERWSKRLKPSDAQRKVSGNQRGSITLVRGEQGVDKATYFRQVLFASADWASGTTRTGKPVEKAAIAPYVTFDGVNLGALAMHVSHDPTRESHQNNYSTLLHLDDLSPYVHSIDVTGWQLVIELRTDGSHVITITP